MHRISSRGCVSVKHCLSKLNSNVERISFSSRYLASAIPRANNSIQSSPRYDEVFPSIVIGGKDQDLVPLGSFAEAQSQYMNPDPEIVASLSKSVKTANMGIVAHYYMDVELQSILNAVGGDRVAIADSLAMGDAAVRMVESGDVKAIACLGVDFMAESVQAILGRAGYGHIPVYRLDTRSIGCSLAESAERPAYRAWLQKRSREENPNGLLHVVYINTSLETKATASSTVPTITCTSSNVVKTMLQASAQQPGIRILYGPDTYMGENLVTFFDGICNSSEWSDEKIAEELHPSHNNETLRRLRDSIDVFPNGNCVVHHMFGSDVVENVRQNYSDAYVTAHLEVPGEMFEIAMEKSMVGMGTVGSTSDILKFISKKVSEAASSPSVTGRKRLKFILGTEAGMITSIVKSVQGILDLSKNSVEAEIIFPVATEAITAVDESDSAGLSIVPGVSGGEGCSTAGGCATCPFMKMNDIDKLSDVVEMVGSDSSHISLEKHLPPRRLHGKTLNGVSATELGVQPIIYMRQFMKESTIPDELMAKAQACSAS
mmetsp:Transcript_13486/g.17658  ORF Transcript_13486/g.17658 Transcript_13486/m.17658 type:complete len:546 (+) Transcript_13486:137-1774(+)